jgi:Protein of unknown function (DUF3761)
MLLRVATVTAIIGAFGTIGSASPWPAAAGMQCSKGYYKAASGDCVHKPVCTPSPPPGATGQCVDGCFTFSEDPNDDDTCHGRGGLQKSF